jgi:Na+/proline symporter
MQSNLYISLYQYFKINSSSEYNGNKRNYGVFVYELYVSLKTIQQ